MHMSIDLFVVVIAITFLVIGALLFAILKPHINRLIAWFKERAPLVKRYWKFVIPLLVITSLAYTLIYIYAPTEINIGLVGQISGLILAVFAGYIAFSELGESRFDKLEESGMDNFRKGEFKLAQTRLEEAHTIKPKDIGLLANLMELYLILGLFDKFETKTRHYRRHIIEEKEELILLYLKCLKELVQDHPKDAKLKIKDVVKYVNSHPRSRDTLGWNNKELKLSDPYKLLSKETKEIADNLVAYVTDKLDTENEAKFVEGNYTLKTK